MEIPRDFRKSVGFLMAGAKHVGTAFLVSVPVTKDPRDGVMIYAVTAGHLIDGTRPDGDLILRVNKVGGGHEPFPVDHDRWIVSPSVDAAVVRVGCDRKKSRELDVVPIPFDGLLSDARAAELDVGEGDEMFYFATLFAAVPEKRRHLPITRFGHVALMPQQDDPIKVAFKDRADCEVFTRTFPAYLAEAYSRGGHSGSPAFLYFPLSRKTVHLTGLTAAGPAGVMAVLGVVAGHYDVDLEADDPTMGNSGIAVIVPAQHIIDLLMAKDSVKEREEARREVEADHA